MVRGGARAQLMGEALQRISSQRRTPVVVRQGKVAASKSAHPPPPAKGRVLGRERLQG